MNWFKRLFAKWSREAWENSRADHVTMSESLGPRNNTRFTIYPASGGYVIEHYRSRTDRLEDGPALTIVNNGDSIGTAVEHILTLDALKS